MNSHAFHKMCQYKLNSSQGPKLIGPRTPCTNKFVHLRELDECDVEHKQTSQRNTGEILDQNKNVLG